jgi:pyruvate/2-oxoglutarate dehydrogenase complex dihydrolipoamide acyltransferase (E2) component
MLRPFIVSTPWSGTLAFQLPVGTPVERGTLLARVEKGLETHDLQSPVSGRVEEKLAEDQSSVAEGQGIAVLAPASEQVWEALRALYLIGRAEDLPEITRYSSAEVAEMPEELQAQAKATAEAIRQRLAHTTP